MVKSNFQRRLTNIEKPNGSHYEVEVLVGCSSVPHRLTISKSDLKWLLDEPGYQLVSLSRYDHAVAQRRLQESKMHSTQDMIYRLCCHLGLEVEKI